VRSGGMAGTAASNGEASRRQSIKESP